MRVGDMASSICQALLSGNPSPSPRLTERPALDGTAAADTHGFSAGDTALYLGQVLPRFIDSILILVSWSPKALTW